MWKKLGKWLGKLILGSVAETIVEKVTDNGKRAEPGK